MVTFLFPGQGSPCRGILQALPKHPAICSTLAETSRELKVPEADLDSAQTVDSPEGMQRALLVAGVACARALEAEGIRPQLVAGMSIGAFSAAVVAGALDLRPTLGFVRERARLMSEAFPSGHGMTALLGLDKRVVTRLLAEIHSPATPVYLASVNSPDQQVIAGSDRALELAAAAARSAGARRVQRLNVAVPSHSPLLAPAAKRLARFAAGLPVRQADLPYLENGTARAVTDGERIRADLVGNICTTVRWHEMVTNAYERGCRTFVEMSPGHVLSELVRAEFPAARSWAFADGDFASLVRSLANRP